MAKTYKKEVLDNGVSVQEWAERYHLQIDEKKSSRTPTVRMFLRRLELWSTLDQKQCEIKIRFWYLSLFTGLVGSTISKAAKKTVKKYRSFLLRKSHYPSLPGAARLPRHKESDLQRHEHDSASVISQAPPEGKSCSTSESTASTLIANKTIISEAIVKAGADLARKCLMKVPSLKGTARAQKVGGVRLKARSRGTIVGKRPEILEEKLQVLDKLLSDDTQFRSVAYRVATREAYDDCLFMLGKYCNFGHYSPDAIASLQKCGETGLLRGIRRCLMTVDPKLKKNQVSIACASAIRVKTSGKFYHELANKCHMCAVTFGPTVLAVVRKWHQDRP
jgi:hypothetical protein